MTEDLEIIKLPTPTKKIRASSMVLHDGAILLCGGRGNEQKCLQLDHGTWKEHSTLNQKRYSHSAVATQTGIFLFGGALSGETYEYLPRGSTTWLMGRTEIPGRFGFALGCAIAVKSDQEILLIGGYLAEKRILSFNVNDHKFKELPFQLNVGRSLHKCAFIPNTQKIMIAGGMKITGPISSTEILDIEDGSVILASPMLNSERCFSGMGVLTIKGEDRLAVFRRYASLDCIESYNSQTEKWETSDTQLSEPKYSMYCFGVLTVKLSDIISELQLKCNNTN